MNVAALDTSTAATVAAVLRADGRAFEARDDPPRGTRPRHAARALALLEEALAAAGLGWAQVDRLAVGVGPGGFTGLRIGIATARALAQGRGLEVVAVSSLAALAEPLGDAAAAIDARRGEVFGAAWAGGREVVAPAAWSPAAFGRAVAGLPAVGDGAVRHREMLEAAGAAVAPDDDPRHRLSGAAVCRLGGAAEPVARDALMPDYRREPDAVPPSGA
jgi:tRNA threonylcarbamoyladenosine biosynthesis protein TsaB